MSIFTDRIQGARSSLAFKAPCRVKATTNITLSGFQTINGVVLADGDTNLRVLVGAQDDASENGIYDAAALAWTRSRDFNGADDIIRGTRVHVVEGSAGQGEWIVDTADPITIGTSDITFVARIEDNSVTYAQFQQVSANSVLTRAAASAGDVGETALSASNVLGRGSTGNVAALTFGSNISVSGTTITTNTVATRTAMAALDTTKYSCVFLTEAGREGMFVWSSTDVSSLVTWDTQQAVYVPPASATSGASGAWVRSYNGGVNIKWAGCVGDGTTNDKTGIQSCIDLVWAKGGGIVFIPEGQWAHSGNILLHQTVTLEGEGNCYVNLYSSTTFDLRGSVLKLITGSNTASVQVRYKAYGAEVLSGPDNVRHQGGIRNLTIWGNRSDNQAPSSVTNNSAGGTGHGVYIRGVSNVHINDVLAVRCAGDGFNVGSYDYSWGTISSNNMMWTDVQSLSNAGRGFNLAGGDQDFHKLTAGYNALNGFTISSGNSSFTGCRAWNNQDVGFYVGIDYVLFSACNAYDNFGAGFYLDAANGVTLSGVICTRNGWDTLLSTGRRSGVFMANSDNVTIDGFFVDDGAYGGPYQQYGIYNNSVNNTVKYGAVTFQGNVLASFGGATTAAKRMPCIQSVNTTNQFTASATYVTASVSATIYPSSVGASVRVTVNGYVGAAAALIASFTLYRDAVDLTPSGVNGLGEVYIPDTNTCTPITFTYVDTPATSGAVTYTLYWKTSASTARLGRRGLDTTIDAPTIITLEEVLA